MVMNELRSHFRPEFLNRLDETILFNPLTRDNMSGIIKLIIQDLNSRLADKDLTIELTGEAEDWIVEQAYDPAYGARPLKRYLQKHVETLVAILILSDSVKNGDVILIKINKGELEAEIKA